MISFTSRYIAPAVLIAALVGCGASSDSGEEPNAAGRRTLLGSVTDLVIVPGFTTLATDAEALATAVEGYAEAVRSGGTADRSALDAAFIEAYRSMQYAELLQIGPYGPPSKFDGGLNIRDEIYSWPSANACRVDQETASRDYADAAFFTNSLVNVYGFDALEYLLYAPSAENRCPASAPLNTSGDWAALSESDIALQRAEYAAVVAREIARRAVEIRDAWAGGFADDLKSAGQSGSTYATTQAGLDALFASMFYAERTVKDTKLARPLGITPDCSDTVCPEFLESQFAQISQVALEANLQAFADLYRGGPDSAANREGFDTLLTEIGAGDLAATLDTQLLNTLSRVPAVSDPMQSSLTDSAPFDLHSALQQMMTTVKTQFVSVLALRVPNEGAADND